MDPRNPEEEARIRQAAAWAASPAGHAAVEAALQEATTMVERLDKVRKLDHRKLQEPYTI